MKMSRIRGTTGLMVLGLCCVLLAAGPGGGAVYGATPLAPAGADKLIDLNDANEQQLMSVPGIGKTLAARIIEFRKEHGPFRRVEDLLLPVRIEIGPARLLVHELELQLFGYHP